MLAKAKRSPIGYEPFVKRLVKAGCVSLQLVLHWLMWRRGVGTGKKPLLMWRGVILRNGRICMRSVGSGVWLARSVRSGGIKSSWSECFYALFVGC